MKKTMFMTRILIMGVSLLVSLSCSADTSGKELDMKNNNLEKSDTEWKKELSPDAYKVLRQKGTERPFSGKYYNSKDDGVYKCAGCGKELFKSENKFDSGCGWPSYWKPADEDAVKEQVDDSLGTRRTEILCSNCGGHLGHVFNDGPKPTGLRYCINSVALDFQKSEIATFGSGCFWCSEAAFETLDGVTDVKVGYMGGTEHDADYKKVCSGKTGHAEVSQVTFDPTKASYGQLLDVFWKIHDPTTLNRQGADIGTQYRSVIFYHNAEQKAEAEKSIKNLQLKLEDPIVTEVTSAGRFFEAEKYHQNYYANNANAPYCRAVIAPKLKKLGK